MLAKSTKTTDGDDDENRNYSTQYLYGSVSKKTIRNMATA